nr:MAG TPA: hypothetical protein [Caudoviricetes sp.]
MGKSKHVLNVRKENIIYTVDLYTKKEECNTGNRCISAFVDKQEVFMPITPYLGNLAAGTSTPVRILKNNTVYQLVQHGEFYLKIQQTPNQTITLHVGGQSWTDENEHWFPYGTQWTATIVGHDGYNPGALNVSSGTLTDNDVTITATAATLAIPTGNTTFPPDRLRHNWVCPPYITRIKCSTQQEADKYYSVIPGTTYQFQMVPMGPDNNAWFLIENNKRKQITDNGYYSLMVSWGPDINNHT